MHPFQVFLQITQSGPFVFDTCGADSDQGSANMSLIGELDEAMLLSFCTLTWQTMTLLLSLKHYFTADSLPFFWTTIFSFVYLQDC
jgi:hypothetical protein